MPPCIARAEEISIPAVEYDISGWEDIWREIQVETGGLPAAHRYRTR